MARAEIPKVARLAPEAKALVLAESSPTAAAIAPLSAIPILPKRGPSSDFSASLLLVCAAAADFELASSTALVDSAQYRLSCS